MVLPLMFLSSPNAIVALLKKTVSPEFGWPLMVPAVMMVVSD